MNLTAYLRTRGVEFEFVDKGTTHHAADASRVTGIPLSAIAKTIVFSTDDQKIIVAVVRADHKVSRHKLQKCSTTRHVEVAPDHVADKATGYPTGGIPPVGHRRRLPVYVDSHVAAMEHVWCGGGTRTRLVRLRTDDLLTLSGAQVCDIATGEEQDSRSERSYYRSANT